jgi:hypothetical protein
MIKRRTEMTTAKLFLQTFGITLFGLILQPLAQAQQPQAYVSTNGNDSGTCERTAPCRQITYALTQVTPNGFNGGTVVVLDSGTYQPFVVTQSVSVVVAEGANAEIPVGNNGIGVYINASSNSTVVLHGLTIKGNRNLSLAGIKVDFVAAIEIKDCFISGFHRGIDSLVVNGEVLIRDTTIRDCIDWGIRINSESDNSLTLASIEHCRIVMNTGPSNNYGVGIQARKNVKVTILDTLIAHNSSHGVLAGHERGSPATIVMEHCSVTHNRGDGIYAGDGATIYVSNSTVAFNSAYGFSGTGVVYSRINNTVEGNNLGYGPATPFAGK